MAKMKGKSKKELLTEEIAAAVGAGREVEVETVDFSDPNRPKTCLEVDFPILPINHIAAVEGSSGATRKPVYQLSKWWARRNSSVFRSLLLAAAMKAPEDETKAAKAVWEVYYANHQKRGAFRHLKVAEPFMGGGTTIVEGSRLGMQMFGCDLNPVAWFVVKSATTRVNVEEVRRVLADIEAEVKPFIMPYYACDGPNGEKGKWFHRAGTKKRNNIPVQPGLLDADKPCSPETEDIDWEELPVNFDIFSIPWQERKNYRYEGPEIIYTFWGKHGPCQREGCGHRTPIMSTPVVATKTLSCDTWIDWKCRDCGKTFDVERHVARMAPDSPLFIAPDEKPFAVMDSHGHFICPHCAATMQDQRAFADGNSLVLGRPKNKKVELTLLMHPQWLEGCPMHDENGSEYGGSATDTTEATIRWNNARASKLRMLEVRGKLPEQVTCPETKITFHTDRRGGTVPKKAKFECRADGSLNDILDACKKSGKTGPMSAYAIQGYSPRLNANGSPYGGRFFGSAKDVRRYNAAIAEWSDRKDGDLKDYWPHSALPYGLEADFWSVRSHGFTHWWTMFNSLQLLIHSQLLRAIHKHLSSPNWEEAELVLAAFQQYLRNQCLFTIWNLQADQLEPQFVKNNFRPKANTIENSVFCHIGRGTWDAQYDIIDKTLAWLKDPDELIAAASLPPEQLRRVSGKSVRAKIHDPVRAAVIEVCSATALPLDSHSFDLCITDPPFGDLLQYSELSDFFYVWLRLVLRDRYPTLFSSEDTPKALEAVENKARHPDDPAAFYRRLLTESWREAFRILKPGGLLAFTFHHSEDEPWVGVLQSLFDAGFYLEATYPIRGDETKGDNAEFGSQTIEYDIIHVCRKRIDEPQPISWARLRRLILDDVRRIQSLLSQHQREGLPAADLQVIKRGKALEYFSRHYGKVYIEQGREFTIREALVGINQLLEDDTGTAGGPEAPPPNAEPFTRQFFRLFYETDQVPRDQMQKFLRGTGIAPSDFTERGWCSEKHKIFTLTPPVELAHGWKGAPRKSMARDFDQAMFLVGGCIEGSNIRVMDTLDNPNFAPHPATAEIVDWLIRHGASQEIKFAAQRARTIYRDWLGKNKAKAQEQFQLFDLGT
jgi:SAM-dependent methyltransferase